MKKFPDKTTLEITEMLESFTEKIERKFKIPFFTLAFWVDVDNNKYHAVRVVLPSCKKYKKWDIEKIKAVLATSIKDFINKEKPWK